MSAIRKMSDSEEIPTKRNKDRQEEDCSNADAGDEASCNISRLPPELRWMIFSFTTEEMGEMRLVNKSWRSMVDEWSIPQNLPQIPRIMVSEINALSAQVEISLCTKQGPCFKQLRELVMDIDRNWISIKSDSSFTEVSIALLYGSSNIMRLASFLSTRLSAAFIGDLIKHSDQDNLIQAVGDLLKHVKHMSSLKIRQFILTDETASFIANCTSKFTLEKLSCNICFGTLTKPRDFLLTIAENMKSIEIEQSVQTNSPDFISSKQENWVELIIEMFERGAQTIQFKNQYTELLSPEELNEITKTLVSRNRSFFFRTCLRAIPIESECIRRVEQSFIAGARDLIPIFVADVGFGGNF